MIALAETSSSVIDISYIVPVYNALPYLAKTVESLLGQNYDSERIELLFVDDGSTDGSGAFLDELANDYPQMRVFHIPASGGPSVPRNVGMDYARGRYVFFCDADDWMEWDATARMVRHADEWGSDVLLVKPKGENGRKIAASAFSLTRPEVDIFESDICQALGPCKLFKRSFLEEHGLRFIWAWPVWEDQPFVTSAYLKADVVSVAADAVYCHWVNRSELSSAMDQRDKVAFDVVFEYVAQMLGLFDEQGLRERAREKFAQRILREGLFYAGRALSRVGEGDARRQYERMRKAVDPYLSDSFNRMCNVQRCLMYQAFRQGDWQEWIAICREERTSALFKPESFQVDNDAQEASAVWHGSSARVCVDARGRFPLAAELVDVRCSGDALKITAELDERALYACEKAQVHLVKRGRGERVEFPAVLERSNAGRALLSASLPVNVFSDSGRCVYWDVALALAYSNGRKKSGRVGIPGGEQVGELGTMVRFGMPEGPVMLLVPYATKGGTLGIMDCLADAFVEAESGLVRSTVALKGVPGRVFEVVGSIDLTFVRHGKTRVVSFDGPHDVPVGFRAGSYEVVEVERLCS